ncbi:hypothetical protein NDU88_003022 [Pleurodeles waltl]|uniref:Uncharacterized protein n=1 Tax=Pleurodeles waltl TaxID=8319 RepID=A0AAV7T449_PLEWA|nr:hypothetical protein NDU88_003022 [Pleurodeles waltl]
MREGGDIRRSASGPKREKESGKKVSREKESREKVDQGEEEREDGTRGQEDTEARTPDRRIWGPGERFHHDWWNPDKEDREGDRNNAATWEAERSSPPRLAWQIQVCEAS